MDNLPDIQNTEPEIRSCVNRVGVSEVELPFLLMLRDGSNGYIQVNAKTEMMCELRPEIRGVSMSRFLRTLKPFLRLPLKRTTMEKILQKFLEVHDTQKVSLKLYFKIPLIKESPLSDNKFPQYYDCSFKCIYSNTMFKFYESVRVQYAAYCPCSAALSQYGKNGYPHSQRAFADILVRTDPKAYVWLEDIIDLVEKEVLVVPYPIIKRKDEKFIAAQAKNQPMFVEDAIRKISSALNKQNDIIDWYVKCTHEESIHPSNAVAINWKGGAGEFDETTYI
jgi:GTP cyclohydrolase I